MTSRGKMLTKLALDIGKEFQEYASCGNSSDSGGKSGYQVKRKLAFSDASNDDILQPAPTKQKTDQRETFLVAKNDTTNVAESDSSEESLNKARKNIDASATTEQKANQLDVCATVKTDTKNQAAGGKTPEVTAGIHRSGPRSDESSSSSSSSESSSSSDSSHGIDSEIVDDTDADKDWNPSSNE